MQFKQVKSVHLPLLFSVLLTTLSAGAQSAKPVSVFAQGPGPSFPRPDQEASPDAKREMAKQANAARQARLKHDTDQLLKLATELKEFADKSNANTLSLDVVRKAEAIEKLAHSVKERMRAGY